jgi:hypothetical protein
VILGPNDPRAMRPTGRKDKDGNEIMVDGYGRESSVIRFSMKDMTDPNSDLSKHFAELAESMTKEEADEHLSKTPLCGFDQAVAPRRRRTRGEPVKTDRSLDDSLSSLFGDLPHDEQ